MKIIEYMINKEMIDESETKVIEFGLDMLRTVLIGGIVAISVGIALGMFWETIFFLALLMPLRQYAGGFHAKTKIGCALLSTVLLVLSVLMFKYATLHRLIQISLYLLGSFFIVKYAPVENHENPLDDLEVKVYGNRTKRILVIESVIFVILFAFKLFTWSFILVWAIVLAAALVVAGYVQMKIS